MLFSSDQQYFRHVSIILALSLLLVDICPCAGSPLIVQMLACLLLLGEQLSCSSYARHIAFGNLLKYQWLCCVIHNQ
jgi:hypothetical protein